MEFGGVTSTPHFDSLLALGNDIYLSSQQILETASFKGNTYRTTNGGVCLVLADFVFVGTFCVGMRGVADRCVAFLEVLLFALDFG